MGNQSLKEFRIHTGQLLSKMPDGHMRKTECLQKVGRSTIDGPVAHWREVHAIELIREVIRRAIVSGNHELLHLL